VVLIACALATACQPAKIQRLRPDWPTTVPSAERLLGALVERRTAVRSLRGFAQIAYESGDDNIGARHAVLVRRPDHFRLEVLSPLGALAVIATDAKELVVYARRERKIYRGPASAGSVGAYTQVPVEVADVASILLGAPPEREATGTATVSRDDEAHAFKVTMPVALGRHLIWFDPQTLAPVASETPLPDGRRLRVAFGEYRDIGTFAFPHAIDMRVEPGDRVVRVRYASPSLNSEINDALFTFPPREGLQELQIEQYSVGGGG
jgi:outer membrane lipoprotein-sorting protein